MANKKYQKRQLPSQNVSDSGKIVKKRKRILPKSQLPQLCTFNRETLLELGMKEDDITKCLTLPKKKILVEIIKNQSKNFNKIKHLFEDFPQNFCSDARKDLNGWTLREVTLLLNEMDIKRFFSPKKFEDVISGDMWQSIKGPRDGVKETWETITKKVPNTMEHVFKRVKTLVVVRKKRPSKKKHRNLNKDSYNFLWNKVPTMLTLIISEIDNATSKRLNLDPRVLYNTFSPLGRTLISLKAMDKIVKESLEFKEREVERKYDFFWQFSSV